MVRRGLPARRPIPVAPRFAVHASLAGNQAMGIKSLWDFGMERDALYALQSEAGLVRMLDDPSINPEEILYYGTAARASEFKEWMLRRCRVWFDVEEWIEGLGECDAAIGMRFHGLYDWRQRGSDMGVDEVRQGENDGPLRPSNILQVS